MPSSELQTVLSATGLSSLSSEQQAGAIVFLYGSMKNVTATILSPIINSGLDPDTFNISAVATVTVSAGVLNMPLREVLGMKLPQMDNKVLGEILNTTALAEKLNIPEDKICNLTVGQVLVVLLAVIVMSLGVAAFVAPAAVSETLLALFGFGPYGIVAGSSASAWHAIIGNAAARGLFATLQSAGMAGYGTAVVSGVMQAGGAIATTAGGVATYFLWPG